MCVVSMVGDHYNNKWRTDPYYGWIKTFQSPNNFDQIEMEALKKKFDDLKKEVEEMKLLLQRAKEYDINNNQPDCETDDKFAMIRKIADMVGVDLKDVIGD